MSDSEPTSTSREQADDSNTSSRTPASTYHLEELTRQVRRHTVELLKSVPLTWLQWSPEGTSNHLLWHAGHALWLQDELGLKRLTGVSELPPGWNETFGARCRPLQETATWPERPELAHLLEQQAERLIAEIHKAEDRLCADGLEPAQGGDLARGLIHGLHDEARHQGEMYLLIKLARLAFAEE